MKRIVLKAAAPSVMNDKSRVQHQFADAKMEPVEGWAVHYGVEVERWWGIMEIAPKAFADSIGKPAEIRILAQHDSWTPIGLARAFTDSDTGLYMSSEVNTETQAGREVMSNVKAGILAAFSVGFNTIDYEVVKVGIGAKAYEKEIITRAELMEVSIVTFPAIDSAKIANATPDLLAEDAQHPGARAELQRILGGNLRR